MFEQQINDTTSIPPNSTSGEDQVAVYLLVTMSISLMFQVLFSWFRNQFVSQIIVNNNQMIICQDINEMYQHPALFMGGVFLCRHRS
mmetsp:Transcript_2278/g.3373  ORF Transcript_2278/g.3373 Transcript_2278/m.3373 type:complete len:87 (+) Transcript_2278:277-537(+)